MEAELAPDNENDEDEIREVYTAEKSNTSTTDAAIRVHLKYNTKKSTKEPLEVYKSSSVFPSERRDILPPELGTAKNLVVAAALANSRSLNNLSYEKSKFSLPFHS